MSSLTFGRASQCSGKKAFANPTLAYRIWNRKRKRKHEPKSVYRCTHCGKWHLGSVLAHDP